MSDMKQGEGSSNEPRMKQLVSAMVAAKQDAQLKGLRQGNGGRGSVKCPICVDGTLNYSVASVNGHMHTACSTKGCTRWIE